MNRSIPFFLLALLPGVVWAQADTLSLDKYLNTLRHHHPFFAREALNRVIEREQQRRFEGEEDWVVKASPYYQYSERSQVNPFIPQRQSQLSLNVGAERLFWGNGGRLSVDYDYNYLEQKYGQPIGAFDQYGHVASVSYTLPLMQNRGGVLNRLAFDLQGYNVVLAEVVALERQEGFLEQSGQRYLDWVFVSEQLRIAENRLALAREELERTERKRGSRLVAEVEVLRARDAVIAAQQDVRRIQVQWRALQAELATQSGDAGLYQMRPSFDLYALKPLPAMDQVMAVLQDNSRLIKRIDVQLAQLAQQQEGVENQLQPTLDLIARAGLSSDDERFADAARFNQPQYMLGLNFRYPLGQSSARAQVSQVRMQHKQLRYERRSVLRQLEAELRNVVVQLHELEAVLRLNRERIEVARQKTLEELQRHNRGRSELTFVIQSRDSEQYAQLVYAENAANYQKLWLRYTSLTDRLLADVQ